MLPDSRWLELIRSEYEEMPDLHLTPLQMQRLWGINPDICRAVVEALVAQKALKLTLAGGYTRLRVTQLAGPRDTAERGGQSGEIYARAQTMPLPLSSTAVGPLRVLVVEDENLIRWAVAETLTDAGHRVVEAPDAATALRAVGQTSEPFDVALLDFRLPDSDDLSLVERIRQQAPATAIVMMTAHGTAQMIEDAKALGVYEVVPKPFDVGVLEDVIVKAHRSKTN